MKTSKRSKLFKASLLSGVALTAAGVALVGYAGYDWHTLSFWQAAVSGTFSNFTKLVAAAVGFQKDGVYLGSLLALGGGALTLSTVSMAAVASLFKRRSTDTNTQEGVDTTEEKQETQFSWKKILLDVVIFVASWSSEKVTAFAKWAFRAIKRRLSRGHEESIESIGSPVVSQARKTSSPLDEWAANLGTEFGRDKAKQDALEVWENATSDQKDEFLAKNILGHLALEKLEQWAKEARDRIPEGEDPEVARVGLMLANNARHEPQIEGWDFEDELIEDGSDEAVEPAVDPVQSVVNMAQKVFAVLTEDEDLLRNDEELAPILEDPRMRKGVGLLKLQELERKLEGLEDDAIWEAVDQEQTSADFEGWFRSNLDTLRNDAKSILIPEQEAQDDEAVASIEDLSSPEEKDELHRNTLDDQDEQPGEEEGAYDPIGFEVVPDDDYGWSDDDLEPSAVEDEIPELDLSPKGTLEAKPEDLNEDLVGDWINAFEVAGLSTDQIERDTTLYGEEGGSAGALTIYSDAEDLFGKNVGVVLRHVPEGNWSLKDQGDLVLTNEEGEMIGIDQTLRDAIQGGFLFLHFHGPGAENIEEQSVDDNIIITRETLSGLRIEDAVSA